MHKDTMQPPAPPAFRPPSAQHVTVLEPQENAEGSCGAAGIVVEQATVKNVSVTVRLDIQDIMFAMRLRCFVCIEGIQMHFNITQYYGHYGA